VAMFLTTNIFRRRNGTLAMPELLDLLALAEIASPHALSNGSISRFGDISLQPCQMPNNL
jgi:hypothetical protein